MITQFFKNITGFGSKRSWGNEIDPDEIFLDSANLPEFNQDQFEGRLEKPIKKGPLVFVTLVVVVCALTYIGRLYSLQVNQGTKFALQSEDNRLRHSLIFADRGIIYDRNGVELAWNDSKTDLLQATTTAVLATSTKFNTRKQEDIPFPLRKYDSGPGLSHILGYVGYPAKDSSGVYYQDRTIGKDGVESTYDKELAGSNGLQIVEVNAKSKIQSSGVIRPPQDGVILNLSIDSRVQKELYNEIATISHKVGFLSGAGVIMDVHTGEILAMASYPEYDNNLLMSGSNQIKKDLENPAQPFLNRAVSGLYTPGSILKPYLAIGALEEGVVTPEKQIEGTAYISIPNPYDKTKETIFKDWKVQGWVDMRHAIAQSSDVYFYEIGGGYKTQKGLGIANIEKYLRLFGFGSDTGVEFANEKQGIIPSPTWKADNFNGEPWRLGDTYHTAIGQYGTQVTPLQAARAVSAIANNGVLLRPTLLKAGASTTDRVLGSNSILPIGAVRLPVTASYFNVVKEGMRLTVTGATAHSLDSPNYSVAAKTGTAEIGAKKLSVNSLVTGFFPYEHPKYAFVVVMEKGPLVNTMGAVYAIRQVLDWMYINTPEYLKDTTQN
jgi:penicillin-binding protein 2